MTYSIQTPHFVQATLEAIEAPAESGVLRIFDEHCAHLKIDAAFIRKLQMYRQMFANKNEDHIAFFGGNLMGVQAVRFTTDDRNAWFDSVLGIDDLSVQDELLQLKTLVPDPEKVRNVSTDVMNLSCLWLVHAIYRAHGLTDRDRQQGMIDALLVLQYKFITSILAYWFPHRADEAVATATYAALNKKFGLKVYGSWGALLLVRCQEILKKESIHYQTYTTFTDDYGIIYMVNDIQGRIKDILKNIRDVFEIIRKDPRAMIRTNANTIAIDGEVFVKAKQSTAGAYRRYLLTVLADQRSFVIEELVGIICEAMPTMSKGLFRETLYYMSRKSGLRGDPDVISLCELTLQHLFDFLNTSRNQLGERDIAGLLSRLMNLYKASRASEPTLLEMRALGEQIVQRAVKTKNKAMIPALRTGVLLYLVLRTVTMHHYQGK